MIKYVSITPQDLAKSNYDYETMKIYIFYALRNLTDYDGAIYRCGKSLWKYIGIPEIYEDDATNCLRDLAEEDKITLERLNQTGPPTYMIEVSPFLLESNFDDDDDNYYYECCDEDEDFEENPFD